MISGMYLGELVRVILVELIDNKLLFDVENASVGRLRVHGENFVFPPSKFPGSFPTKFVSEVEADLLADERNFANTFGILEDLGIDQVTLADCANVAYVCSLASSILKTPNRGIICRFRPAPRTCAPPPSPLSSVA